MSEKFLKNWRAEKQSVFLYHALAEVEKTEAFHRMFLRLAEEAERQAGYWEKKIQEQGRAVPDYVPDWRARAVVLLLRRFGPRHMHLILAGMKVRGLSVYSTSPPGHPTPTTLQEVGRRHKATGASGILRAAVFGINDGLISNASLMMGFAGASSQSAYILLSGIAGLLAGAFSMGAGEYLSMRSQREMFEHQIGLEKEELREYPEQEAAELALIFEAKGLSEAESKEVATKLIGTPLPAHADSYAALCKLP